MKLKKILVAAFAAAATVLFVACDSPEKAVATYTEAMIERDAEKLASVLYFDKDRRESKKDKKQSDAEWAHDFLDKGRGGQAKVEARKNIKIIGSMINGTKATVVVGYIPEAWEDMGMPGFMEYGIFTCEKDEGKWKVFEEKGL